jgi:uncharacterized flavoprotein (TIGR03862 family)
MSKQGKLAVVIGAGPAGLMAAGELAKAGHRVVVAEGKPSVARKFLMAGKSGLNLTKDEQVDKLLRAYGDAADWLSPMIRAFDPAAIQCWARDLGSDLFIGSTSRVFPRVMKASPLLRNWLAELGHMGVEIRTRWRWTGWQDSDLLFETPNGPEVVNADVTVLALGGASWSRLGSDGAWTPALVDKTVTLTPFSPSNAALSVDWSDHMHPHFGAALKAVRWSAGECTSRGEAIISRRGLEGGGLYGLTPALRKGMPLFVDLVPDRSLVNLENQLSGKKKNLRLAHWLKNTLRLPPAKIALFFEMVKGSATDRSEWARLQKSLPVHHAGLRPMDEAISTAGGVPQSELDDGLMLKKLPGVFCAGEMLDWEAPTGGYLLTGCFATGRWAGQAASNYLDGA